MSGRIMHEVLENAPESLTRLELLVLVALADSAGPNTRTTAKGGAATMVLAHKCRTSPGSIRNVLARLVDRGLIKQTGPRAHRGNAQNYYLAPLTEYHRSL